MTRINLRYQVGGEAPVIPEDCIMVKSASKSPVSLVFPADKAGQRVFIFGQWENTRSETGPWNGEAESAIVP